jgi:alpha-N-acetylglucosamine transferase
MMMKKTSDKYAYVFLMFGGTRYLMGVLVAAYSIIRYKTKHDIVCMVTDDVPISALNELKKLNIKIKKVPYLEYKIKKRKMNKRYENWISKSFTKWNCLNLTEYKKILFLDADIFAVKPIDSIFRYKAPLGVFANGHDMHHVKSNNVKNYYTRDKKPLKFLEEIRKKDINKALRKKGFVPTATSVFLEPNKKHFKNFKKMMKKMQPFGFNSYSGYDEESLIYFMSISKLGPQLTWRNLTEKYTFILWLYNQQKRDDKDVKIIDYLGNDKPWELKRNEFPDVEIWYGILGEMLKKYPTLDLNNIPCKYIKDAYKKNDYTNKYYKYFKIKPKN